MPPRLHLHGCRRLCLDCHQPACPTHRTLPAGSLHWGRSPMLGRGSGIERLFLYTCSSLYLLVPFSELSLPLDGDTGSPLSLSYCSEGTPKAKAQLPLPHSRSPPPPPFYLRGLRTWYLLVELKGISATLGFFSLISFTELYDCSMNLRRADSEASPVVSRCQDGVCTVSARGTAQGEGCDGEDLGAIPEIAGGRGWARPDPTGLIP